MMAVNQAQKMSKINLVRSKRYDDNIETFGDHGDTCIVCGRRTAEKLSVHLLTSGHLFDGDDHPDSQGAFPIGPECAKKLPPAFVFSSLPKSPVKYRDMVRSVSILSDAIVWNTNGAHSLQELTKKQYMDLQTAKKEIVAKSRKSPKTKYFLNVDDEGEVNISEDFDPKASGFCYRNGSEIALPEYKIEPKNKTIKEGAPNAIMAKKNGKKSAPAAKKSAADWGKKVKISIADMRKAIKKGQQFRNLQGQIMSGAHLASKARQEHVREMYSAKAE